MHCMVVKFVVNFSSERLDESLNIEPMVLFFFNILLLDFIPCTPSLSPSTHVMFIVVKVVIDSETSGDAGRARAEFGLIDRSPLKLLQLLVRRLQ